MNRKCVSHCDFLLLSDYFILKQILKSLRFVAFGANLRKWVPTLTLSPVRVFDLWGKPLRLFKSQLSSQYMSKRLYVVVELVRDFLNELNTKNASQRHGLPDLAPKWSDWPQMGQIQDFYRYDFSIFWFGEPDLFNLGPIWPLWGQIWHPWAKHGSTI